MAGQRTLKPQRYPRGIPVQAPPGWRPPLPPPRRAASPFRAQVGLILRAMLLSMLVITCMGVGWFLVNGRRPARATGGRIAAAPVKEKYDRKSDTDPAVAPKEKESPAKKKGEDRE